MTRKAAFHNLGCKVNAYEVEAMRQMLEEAGYEIVPFGPGADVYVINTCTVTNIADRKSRQMLHRAKKMNPEAVVVAVGCYAQVRGGDLQQDPAVDLVIGTNRKKDLKQQIEEFLQTGIRREDSSDLRRDTAYEDLKITRTEGRTRAFIKVQDGCDRYCTYCIIPYARGRIRSRRPEEVCQEAARIVRSGVQEIVLTGIHICSYGKDLEEQTDLTDLICAVHAADGLSRLRLSSLEPSFVTERFVRTIAGLPKLCPHFHLSLQSGCDRTLQRMGRRYTTEEFAEKAAMLRKAFPGAALTTDLIAGFPGETEEEFAETVRFVDQMDFFETHIFPYSRREGTKAAAMEGQKTEKEKKERVRVLMEMHARHQENYLRGFLGEPVEVLFEESVRLGDTVYQTGHGRQYQKVMIPGTEDLSGKIRTVLPAAVRDGALFG